LTIDGLRKSYGSTLALDGVSLRVRAGEVHGIVGHNGSGKSTLLRVLGGRTMADTGHAEVWDKPVDLTKAWRPSSVNVVWQELGLIDSLSVVENFAVGARFGSRRGAPIRWRALSRQVEETLSSLGAAMTPGDLVASLPTAQKVVLAVARSLYEQRVAGAPRALVCLDETTGALTADRAAVIHDALRAVTAQGGSALFVGHAIDEVLAVCDRVTVLRSGQLVATLSTSEIDATALLEHMFGESAPAARAPAIRDRRNAAPSADHPTAVPVLELRGLSGMQVRDVTLSVASGEVVAVTGLAGTGHDELPYLLADGSRRIAGQVFVRGQELGRRCTPWRAIHAGLVTVPGSRSTGLWMDGTAGENVVGAGWGSYTRRGAISSRRYANTVLAQLADVKVRPLELNRSVRTFSGGNQQKVMLARALYLDPRILVLHEPTHGVDANAKQQILAEIRARAAAGMAVLLVSHDYDDIEAVATRAVVLINGRVAAELGSDQITRTSLLAHSSQNFIGAPATDCLGEQRGT
jgi:ribose transport system ATP-binding protein